MKKQIEELLRIYEREQRVLTLKAKANSRTEPTLAARQAAEAGVYLIVCEGLRRILNEA